MIHMYFDRQSCMVVKSIYILEPKCLDSKPFSAHHLLNCVTLDNVFNILVQFPLP